MSDSSDREDESISSNPGLNTKRRRDELTDDEVEEQEHKKFVTKKMLKIDDTTQDENNHEENTSNEHDENLHEEKEENIAFYSNGDNATSHQDHEAKESKVSTQHQDKDDQDENNYNNIDPNLVYIPQDKVGQIIGSKGVIIKDLQSRTGCRFVLNQNFPSGVDRTLTFEGAPEQIAEAKRLVHLILTEGPSAVAPEMGANVSTIEIDCPPNLVGRVIGSGGSVIKDMQGRTGAKIQVNQDFPEGMDRKIVITGSPQAIELASQMVSYLLETAPSAGGGGAGGNGYPPHLGGGGYGGMPMNAPMQQHIPQQQQHQPIMSTIGASGQHIVEVQKNQVGKIIGRGGETISLIQSKSGAKVQIDQNVVPCRVLITGSPQTIVVAAAMVQEIVTIGPDRIANGTFSMAAPSGGYGGGYPQSHHLQPQQQPGPYGMAEGYSQPQGYGYPQQQQQQPQQYGYQQPLQQQQPQTMAYGSSQQQQQHRVPSAGYVQPQLGGGGGSRGGQYPQPQAQAILQTIVPKPPAQSPWAEYKTETGQSYWYNSVTRVSQWERPSGF